IGVQSAIWFAARASEESLGTAVAYRLRGAACVCAAGVAVRPAGGRHRRCGWADGDHRAPWNAGRRRAIYRKIRRVPGVRMSSSRRILIIGSLALLGLSMAYGLWYALAVEHQRLDQIGGSLAGSFLQAADRNLDGAQKKLQEYGDARYRYTREVDAHSHWTGLALLLVLLGAAFDQVAFAERMRIWLAWLLLISATGFPACVLWQNL